MRAPYAPQPPTRAPLTTTTPGAACRWPRRRGGFVSFLSVSKGRERERGREGAPAGDRRNHVPEAGGRRRRAAAGDGVSHEQRGLGRRRRRHVLPGGGPDGLRGARDGAAGGRVVHRPLRLLRRLRQLLRDVPVPVHHVRAGGGDHRPGVDVVRGERGAVRADRAADGVPVRLLLLLPRQDARAVRPPGEPLPRLHRPLLLRALRPLPGLPRAQEARLRHEHGMAREHGEAGAHGGDHAAPPAPRDDPLIT